VIPFGVVWLLVAAVGGFIAGRVIKHGRDGDFEDRLEALEDEADARRVH
jgi:hypothetical protein